MAFGTARHLARLGTAGVCAAVFTGAAIGEGMPAPDADTLAAQWDTYMADTVRSPVEFSPMRAVQEVPAADGATLRLTSLHPRREPLVSARDRSPPSGQGRPQSWHFENADAEAWRVSLSTGSAPALLIDGHGRAPQACAPWAGDTPELATAAASGLPYAPVCGGRLYLRNRVRARKHQPRGGVGFPAQQRGVRRPAGEPDQGHVLRGRLPRDSADFGDAEDDSGDAVAALGTANLARTPADAHRDGPAGRRARRAACEAGTWYEVEDRDGVFASVMQPGLIADEILDARSGANGLDGIERNADVYLVAFDLTRVRDRLRDRHRSPGARLVVAPVAAAAGDYNLPGPDGFDRPDPLVLNGMLRPTLLPDRVVATFTGGFKRDHGAFRFGDYADLQPRPPLRLPDQRRAPSRALAPTSPPSTCTIDGEVGMKTWEEADDAMIARPRLCPPERRAGGRARSRDRRRSGSATG